MAARSRLPPNVSGKYFVDEACLGCGLCAAIAPHIFARDSDEHADHDYDYVFQQPQDSAQESLCREAMQACPGNAIRDDGQVQFKPHNSRRKP